MRILRKIIHLVGSAIVLFGTLSFFVEFSIVWVTRDQVPLRGLNWTVRSTSEAIRLPDGRYAIAVNAVGRIQIYSPSRQFLYGWQTGHLENLLRLRPDGTLDDYTALNTSRSRHRWAERVYDVNGVLLSKGYSDAHLDELPGQRPIPIAVPHALPSWLALPLYGPLYAWGVMFAGGMLALATMTREQWAASRQRARRLRAAG